MVRHIKMTMDNEIFNELETRKIKEKSKNWIEFFVLLFNKVYVSEGKHRKKIILNKSKEVQQK